MTQVSASDRKQVRKAEKNAARFEKDRLDGLRHLLSNPAGRLWAWELLATAGTFSGSFAGEAPITQGHNEGRRSVGLSVYADISAHFPETFIQMMREANDRRTLDTAVTLADASAIGATAHPVGTDRPAPERDAVDDDPSFFRDPAEA